MVFAAKSEFECLKADEASRILSYLAGIPTEASRTLGFTVIIDMRGSTWGSIKPILKALQVKRKFLLYGGKGLYFMTVSSFAYK